MTIKRLYFITVVTFLTLLVASVSAGIVRERQSDSPANGHLYATGDYTTPQPVKETDLTQGKQFILPSDYVPVDGQIEMTSLGLLLGPDYRLLVHNRFVRRHIVLKLSYAQNDTERSQYLTAIQRLDHIANQFNLLLHLSYGLEYRFAVIVLVSLFLLSTLGLGLLTKKVFKLVFGKKKKAE